VKLVLFSPFRGRYRGGKKEKQKKRFKRTREKKPFPYLGGDTEGVKEITEFPQ
jgi:hypothetical protein